MFTNNQNINKDKLLMNFHKKQEMIAIISSLKTKVTELKNESGTIDCPICKEPLEYYYNTAVEKYSFQCKDKDCINYNEMEE